MKYTQLNIADIGLIETQLFRDDMGIFMESFLNDELKAGQLWLPKTYG